jgi:hypothetical protein
MITLHLHEGSHTDGATVHLNRFIKQMAGNFCGVQSWSLDNGMERNVGKTVVISCGRKTVSTLNTNCVTGILSCSQCKVKVNLSLCFN